MDRLIHEHKAMKIIQMKMRKTGWFFVLILLFAITSCGGDPLKQTDTARTGQIKVGVDDSYTLLVAALQYTFENNYKYARLDTLLKPEADVFNDFMNDSVPLIIVSRDLTANQRAYLEERNIRPRSTPIALDAVAFILNKANPDSNFFYSQIKDIFTGKITRWAAIRPGSGLGEIRVVFDNFKSSNPRYMKEKFGVDSFPTTCMAAKNNREVIEFVEKNPNAIGVLSVNWISDPADSLSFSYLKRFRVANIAAEGDNDPSTTFFSPVVGYIYTGYYPFTRTVYAIDRQSYAGLASGFTSFIAKSDGQLIVKHSGLAPVTKQQDVIIQYK